MKFLLSLISLVVLMSCSSASNIVYHSELKKRVKVFENEDFRVYYPKSWVSFNSMTAGDSRDSIFRVSPKKKLYDSYIYLDTINGDPKTVIGSKESEVKHESVKHKITEPNTQHSFVEVYVFKNKNTTIDAILEEIKNKAQQIDEIDLEVNKVSDSFYITESRYQATNRANNFSLASSLYKTYIRSTAEGEVYQITYKASEYYFTDNEEDANMALRTFELKDKSPAVTKVP
ncbi:hypothetical protein [Psychroflexus aestuariivivens]|uniref:hypothetical protein n=1 Tax=Psychroflexus aestuariivivens TaxID=1795040 RepID=UPI000FD84EAB|nr:hypothetical protein [Psychroflexus aestuariivivens]